MGTSQPLPATDTPLSRLLCSRFSGITGQDGSYLTELLLEKGYEVHGLSVALCSPSCDPQE